MILNRSEVKFRINEYEKSEIIKYISRFCKPDSHGEIGRYKVNTLYLDDKNLKSYHEKLDGDYTKTKYRLRYYDEDIRHLNGEVKTKEGQNSVKFQFPLETSWGDSFEQVLKNNRNSFTGEVFSKRLFPVLSTSYSREAYTSLGSENIRLTFDSDLKISRKLNFEQEKQYINYPLKDYIMELKFSTKNTWVLNLLAELEQRKVSFSKYFHLLEYSRIN